MCVGEGGPRSSLCADGEVSARSPASQKPRRPLRPPLPGSCVKVELPAAARSPLVAPCSGHTHPAPHQPGEGTSWGGRRLLTPFGEQRLRQELTVAAPPLFRGAAIQGKSHPGQVPAAARAPGSAQPCTPPHTPALLPPGAPVSPPTGPWPTVNQQIQPFLASVLLLHLWGGC